MTNSNSKDFVEIQAQWASVRGRIRQKIGDAQFKSWIKLIKLENFQDRKVFLSVNSNFLKTRITDLKILLRRASHLKKSSMGRYKSHVCFKRYYDK